MLVWQAHKARIRHMAFSPDGAELATTAGTSKFVWLWRAATGEPAGKLAGHAAHARAVAYSPDGRFLASTQNAESTHVWNRASGEVIDGFFTPGWCIESVAFRPDSSGLAVATANGILEWSTGGLGDPTRPAVAPRRLGTGGVADRVLFSPCGRYLLSAYELCHADGAPIRRLADPLGQAYPAQAAFAPDGNTLAVVFGLRIHLFEVPHGGEVAALRGHPNYIHALGFMPDGRSVVSAGADGIVRVWDVGAGAQARSFDWGIGKVCAAAVSPDGTLCAAGGENGKVVVWDVDA